MEVTFGELLKSSDVLRILVDGGGRKVLELKHIKEASSCRKPLSSVVNVIDISG